jgi:hypothetical protein
MAASMPPTWAGAPIGLGAGEDQVVAALFHGGLEQGGEPLAVGTVEGVVTKQQAVVGTHGHLPAKHLFGFVVAHGDHRNAAAYIVTDLDGLFHGVVVPLVDRIDQVVAFDVAAVAVDLDLVFSGVGNPFDTDLDFHVYPPVLVQNFKL